MAVGLGLHLSKLKEKKARHLLPFGSFVPHTSPMEIRASIAAYHKNDLSYVRGHVHREGPVTHHLSSVATTYLKFILDYATQKLPTTTLIKQPYYYLSSET